jgi:hypothetical protein
MQAAARDFVAGAPKAAIVNWDAATSSTPRGRRRGLFNMLPFLKCGWGGSWSPSCGHASACLTLGSFLQSVGPGRPVTLGATVVLPKRFSPRLCVRGKRNRAPASSSTHPRLMRKPAKYWKTLRKAATQTDDWRCACSLVPRRVGEAPPLAGRAQMRPKSLPSLETDLEHGASRRDVR